MVTMNKVKKTFFIIWLISILLIIALFVFGRISKFDFVNTSDFKFLRLILLLYMIYDYFKFNLEACKVDSQFLYVLCILVALIFIFAGLTFILNLDYCRISEFSFFILLSIGFRLLSMSAKVPNFLLLKRE